MRIGDKTVLVCDCGATMRIDPQALRRACGADAGPEVHHALCRGQIAAYERALGAGGAVIVGCTQEAPLFAEVADDQGAEAAPGFFDIRDGAGWGRDGDAAGPKIAALVAAAAVTVPPAPAVRYESAGRTLVYGRDEAALDAAGQLAGRLDVSVLLHRPAEVMPPRVRGVAIHRGTITAASGHLGAFEVTVADYAPADPSARGVLAFADGAATASVACDVILDLAGAEPLFLAHQARDGYLRPDPGNPAAVQKALFDMVDLVGTFDKPRYVDFDAGLCAHSRSRKTGCTRCLDVCPTGAITPGGDVVSIDPHVCAGCGACASVCPTGAAGYAVPAPEALFARLRTVLITYRQAGGARPVLLVHDGRDGADAIAAIGRYGDGLPANVIPFAVNETGQAGLDFLLSALAFGAARVVLLATRRGPDTLAGVAGQVGLAETILAGLGYGSGRVAVVDEREPDALEARLWALADGEAIAPASFLPMGAKRDRLWLALGHLHDAAPEPADRLPLPAGAPFGAVAVDAAGCTLCLACVGACPTGALRDNPDTPQLGFQEQACIQCGLCRNTCPESVITLVPRIDFTAAARETKVLKEEAPFACIRCGKPFGVASTVERIAERLAGHAMFAGDPAAIDRVRMCEDCRVVVQFEAPAPLAGRPRPKPRTADDPD